MTDEINNPKHYQLFPDMQAIDVISAVLSRGELIGYLKGNALKYRLRAGDKGPAEKCIAKANWYQATLRELLGQKEMPESFGQKNMIEPASEIDDDSERQLLIQQGGEMAEYVYPAIDQDKFTANGFCRGCGAGPLVPHRNDCRNAIHALTMHIGGQ